MNNFSNDQVLINNLPNWENVVFERVSSKYRYSIILTYVIFSLLCLCLLIAIGWLNEAIDYRKYIAIGAIGITVLFFLCVLNVWSTNYWGYALREKDILYKSGVFSRAVQIVSYKHIQHVQIKEGLMERFFSLASVELFTAGMGKSLKVPGIDKDTCHQIQQYISEKISVNKA